MVVVGCVSSGKPASRRTAARIWGSSTSVAFGQGGDPAGWDAGELLHLGGAHQGVEAARHGGQQRLTVGVGLEPDGSGGGGDRVDPPGGVAAAAADGCQEPEGVVLGELDEGGGLAGALAGDRVNG